LEVKKPKGNDIKWSNPYGDQATHFTSYTKTPNVKIPTTIVKKQKPHLMQDLLYAYCLPTKGKTQVGWVVIIR